MDIQVLLNQMIIIFLLMLLGYILSKTGVLNEEGSKVLSNLIATVLNPAIILASAADKERAGDMEDMFIALALAVVIYAALIVVGNIIPFILFGKRSERSLYTLMTIFGNIGFIGIPIVSAVLGKGAVIFITAFNLPFNVLIYTYGIYLLTKEKGKQKIQWKEMVSPGLLASVLAILIFVFQIPVPEVVVATADYLGNAIVSLSMLVIGVSLAQIPLREIFSDIRMYGFVVIRMLLVPVAGAVCMKPFIENEILYQVSVLMLAMPVASMVVILAKKYDADAVFAGKGVVLSTILSVVTVPLVAWALTFI